MKQIISVLTMLTLLLMAGCDSATSVDEADFSPDEGDISALAFSKRSTPRATGSGHFFDTRFPPDPLYRSFSFTAIEGSAKGRWQVFNRNGPTRVAGTVECVSFLANRAWFAGTITQSNIPDRIGTILGFSVVDNGRGAGAPPDQLTHLPTIGSAEDYCRDQPEETRFGLIDIENGDILVR